jgi:hypothetical protein
VGTGYASVSDSEELVKSVIVPVIVACVSRFSRVVVTPGTRCTFFYARPDALGGIFNRAGSGSGTWGFECVAPILYYGKDPFLADGLGRRPNSFEQSPADFSEKNGHPCPKPIKVMTWLINRSSRENETILDPFMGSGTTLRAAKDLGRKAIGIEIEEKYCEIAARRMEQEVLPLTDASHLRSEVTDTAPLFT